MKPTLILTALLFSFSLYMVSCGGKDKKAGGTIEPKTETTVKENIEDGMVPAIDTANLKDEASILDAMQKATNARIADEKKQKEDPSYKGHYLELIKIYTAVLKASTAYSQSMTDPAKAVEFNNKVSEIQNKMYQ